MNVNADDFTSASNAASFMAPAGAAVSLYDDALSCDNQSQVPVRVASLKSHRVAPQQALALALQALAWLQQQGCERFYFRCCSTFDGTPQDGIAPVTDTLNRSLAAVFQALPVNSRIGHEGCRFASQFAVLRYILKVTLPNVRLKLNLFHAQQMNNDLNHVIETLADDTGHIQIASLPKRQEPDRGEIGYPWIDTAPERCGYRGTSPRSTARVPVFSVGYAGPPPGYAPLPTNVR